MIRICRACGTENPSILYILDVGGKNNNMTCQHCQSNPGWEYVAPKEFEYEPNPK